MHKKQYISFIKILESPFVLLVALILLLPYLCYAFDDGDFQVWHNDVVGVKLTKNWRIIFEEELHFGDSGGDFYYHHSDFGIEYTNLTNWLDMGVNYRLIYEEKNKDWQRENRPYLYANFKYNIYKFQISNKSRVAYRDKEAEKDCFEYMNKTVLKFPKVTNLEVEPYISEEIYFESDRNKWDQNRLTSGISFKIIKNLKGELYYMWLAKQNSSNHWVDSHIFGTKLKLSL